MWYNLYGVIAMKQISCTLRERTVGGGSRIILIAALLAVSLTVYPLMDTLARSPSSIIDHRDKDWHLSIDGNLVPVQGGTGEVLHAAGAPAGTVRQDTVYIMGGPDRIDGKFQDRLGNPDWGGWTHHDLTAPIESNWQISTFNCSNLDPQTGDNHAWWCGQEYQSCLPGQDPRGYGNGYSDRLSFYGVVTNSSQPVNITITALLNIDTEPPEDGYHYDQLFLERETSDGYLEMQMWEGQGDSILVQEVVTLFPEDFISHPDTGAPAVHLRWRFVSDGAWSQEDCDFPNDGGAQIDNISVSLDGVMVSFEDCEDAAPENNDWRPTLPASNEVVGDFAQLQVNLQDLDPCRSNTSPQVVFVDDGLVVPGTGGSLGTTWPYGPGGYIVNNTGGLAGPDDHIHNEVWSPPLPWPDLVLDKVFLSFDVYRHEALGDTLIWPGVYYTWSVRSTVDPAGEEGWTAWQDRNFVYYGGPDYLRVTQDVSDLLGPGRQWIQVALGVYELGWVWGWNGTDGTPAPYFDNVAVFCTGATGPAISTRTIDLAQDCFPASGVLDYSNLGANSVRFDMAQNISSTENVPGDSVVCNVVPIRAGSSLTQNPRMYYRLNPNPLFDGVRSGQVEGFVVADSCRRDNGSAILNRYFFDLPDEGFFFPGDVIHYYFEAQDNAGGGGITILPADTTGFSVFPGDDDFHPLSYSSSFTVRALPTLFAADPDSQPQVLFWNDYANRDGQDEWRTALRNLGYREGVEYDVYYTNGPSSHVGNGLGGRAAYEQIGGYRTLLYSCGDHASHTLSESQNDLQLLVDWFNLGAKNALFTGDNLVRDLAVRQGAMGDIFLNNWIGGQYVSSDVGPLIQNQISPEITPIFGNGILEQVSRWYVDGSCPEMNQFDAVYDNASAQRIAEFCDVNGNYGVHPYAAGLYHAGLEGADVVYLPYDLMYIGQHPGAKVDSPSSARTKLLDDILEFFGDPHSLPGLEIPALEQCSATIDVEGGLSIWCLPNGSGAPLTEAYSWGGELGSSPSTVDATITVTIRDSQGRPIPNYPAEDIWLESSGRGMAFCLGGTHADRCTDDLGQTTFSRPLFAGGNSIDEVLRVFVGEAPIPGDEIPLVMTSPDINGDLGVNLSDIALMTPHFSPPYYAACDYYRDGLVDILDLVLFARGYEEYCP